jgi:ribosomal protein S27E
VVIVDADSFRPLPVSWDARPVDWEPWREQGRIFICDRSKRKSGLTIPSCSVCGSRRLFSTTGLRHPIAGDTVQGEYLRTHRNGDRVFAQEPMPPYRDLFATRCGDCGHDQVYDARSGELWDLGPEDYGLTGSVAPDA